MKLFVTLSTLALIAIAASLPAAPKSPTKEVELLSTKSEINADGSYDFDYTLSDGTKRTEHGVIKNAGTDQATLEMDGTITWVDPNGVAYTTSFIANENGFQPMGAHLPK